jgi:hypothetical protein
MFAIKFLSLADQKLAKFEKIRSINLFFIYCTSCDIFKKKSRQQLPRQRLAIPNYIYNNVVIYIKDLTFKCRMKFVLIKELWKNNYQ